jgi:hypothetical protein
MTPEKSNFLKNEYLPLLMKVDPSIKPLWGKMNFQQMVEHMSDSIRIANGKAPHKLHTPTEVLDRYKAFLMTEKPFKENTKNVLLGDEPALVRHSSISKAFDELQNELNDFFKIFAPDHAKIITDPFFGDLNFTEWVQLLHKHAVHHLKQFGVNI